MESSDQQPQDTNNTIDHIFPLEGYCPIDMLSSLYQEPAVPNNSDPSVFNVQSEIQDMPTEPSSFGILSPTPTSPQHERGIEEETNASNTELHIVGPVVRSKDIPFNHSSTERRNVPKLVIRKVLRNAFKSELMAIYEQHHVPKKYIEELRPMLEKARIVERCSVSVKHDYTGLLNLLLSDPRSLTLVYINMQKWIEKERGKERKEPLQNSKKINMDTVDDYLRFMRSLGCEMQ